jgi:hypothetical protein
MGASALYLSAGKQEFRELILALARAENLRTAGTFYGTGIDTRLFAAGGLDVLATEVQRSLWPAMDTDADLNGFRVWHGDAARLTERLDLFHADFVGNASGHVFRTLRQIAATTEQWLAVTVASDHQINPWMQGEAALYTVPAFMVGAADGFTLEYFARYARNAGGQRMFVALLQRRVGRGNSHRVQPVQLAYSVARREYWASRAMYRRFGGVLPHSTAPETEHERQRAGEYYAANRERRLSQARAIYQRRKQRPEVIERDRARTAEWAKSETGRAWRRAFDKRRRADPERVARVRAYQREWYARKKAAAVSGTAAEAIEKAA